MILFFGDSITYRNRWEQMLGRDDIINLGIDGNTTHDMLYRLESIELGEINTVSLMAGINDIALGENAREILQRYEVIIEHFKENDLRVIVNSTLHVTIDCFESEQMNDQVNLLNYHLKRICREEGIEFCDVDARLSPKGVLEAHYSVDGVHLSQAAYEVWSQMLGDML